MQTRSTRMLLASAAVLMLAGACSKDNTTTTTATTATTAKAAGSTVTTAASTGTTAKSTGTTTAGKQGDLSALLKDVKLVNSGKLTICSDIPYAPFEFEKDGKLTGFDVNVVDAMAKALAVGTEWKTTPFDTIIPALASGSCDLIASATTITDERKEKVNFTKGYFDADQSLLVPAKDKDSIKKLEDLKDKVIGVQAGTTGAEYATKNKPEGATVKEYPGADDLFLAVSSGDIAAVLQDYPVNAYRALQDSSKFAVTETFPTGEEYGFATNKDNEKLNTALDTALGAVKADGQYDDIYKTWFGDKPK